MDSSLFQNISNEQLASQLRQLFADFEYMGIMEKYGTYCLFISSLVAAILREHGYQVELRTCVAKISQNHINFYLGSKQFAKAEQLPTHVICVVNHSILIDFGLGNARQYFGSDFFQGVVLEIKSNSKQFGQQELINGYKLVYLEDEAPESLFTEIAAQHDTLTHYLNEYHRYCKNRFKFNLARAFRKLQLRRQRPGMANPELLKMAGSFDDTWCH